MSLPPSLEPRFEFLRELGAGGFGRVSLVRDRSTEGVFALKQVFEVDPARAQRELTAATRVVHPCLLRCFESGILGDGAWMLLEVAEGDLSSSMRDPGQVGENFRHLARALRGLAALHEVGIVHRDVKPSNLLRTAEGAKVGDLGLVRMVDLATLTRTGIVQGTPGYLAPEQVLGRKATPASDVFAVGVTAYLALEGRLPFASDDPITQMHDAARGKLLPLTRSSRARLDPALADLVQAMLAPEPADRPRALVSAADLFEQQAPSPSGEGAAAGRRDPRPRHQGAEAPLPGGARTVRSALTPSTPAGARTPRGGAEPSTRRRRGRRWGLRLAATYLAAAGVAAWLWSRVATRGAGAASPAGARASTGATAPTHAPTSPVASAPGRAEAGAPWLDPGWLERAISELKDATVTPEGTAGLTYAGDGLAEALGVMPAIRRLRDWVRVGGDPTLAPEEVRRRLYEAGGALRGEGMYDPVGPLLEVPGEAIEDLHEHAYLILAMRPWMRPWLETRRRATGWRAEAWRHAQVATRTFVDVKTRARKDPMWIVQGLDTGTRVSALGSGDVDWALGALRTTAAGRLRFGRVMGPTLDALRRAYLAIGRGIRAQPEDADELACLGIELLDICRRAAASVLGVEDLAVTLGGPPARPAGWAVAAELTRTRERDRGIREIHLDPAAPPAEDLYLQATAVPAPGPFGGWRKAYATYRLCDVVHQACAPQVASLEALVREREGSSESHELEKWLREAREDAAKR